MLEKFLLLEHLSLIFSKVKAYVLSALPVAATSVKAGIVKPGTGLSVAADGTLNVTGEAAVEASALPVATKTAKGAVIVGDNISVDANGKISVAAPLTKVSELTNDVKYQTDTQVASAIDTAVKAGVAEVVGGAPETFDTLKEIADYIETHKSVETALNEAIGKKADKTSVYTKAEADSKFATIADMVAATEAEIEAIATEVFGE